MEVIVVIGIIWFIWAAYKNYKENQAKEALEQILREIEEERRRNVFKCRVIDDTFEGGESDFDIFHIQMKGIVEGPHDEFDVKYIVQMLDVTNGKSVILSTIEEFQRKDSTVFWFESSIDELPYESTIFKDWSTTAKIPKLFLEFPRSGSRKIEFKVFVVDANTDKILSEDNTIVTYYNSDKGYQDKSEDKEYFEEMIIKTAMLVSASDGKIDFTEANVVKSWIQKRISFYKDEYKDAEKERLNGYIKEAHREIQNNDINIYDALEGIEHIASDGEKFELFQVCLDVAQADGEADKAELEIVHDIADYINLDRDQFKSMIEKTLPVTMHTSPANEENLLGVTSSMTEMEIKRILREQYQKWNARVASTDPKIRAQAEEMIQLIAEAKKKYT